MYLPNYVIIVIITSCRHLILFLNSKFIPIFYICLVSICVIGQISILIKKHNELKIDRIAGYNVCEEDKTFLNTRKWNEYVCSTTGTFLMLLVIFSITLTKYILDYVLADYLNSDEKLLLNHNLVEIILNVVIPLYVYVKNKKLHKHVKQEILNMC